MTEKKEAGEAPGKRTHSPLYEATRRVLLAGVGAVILAQDEVEKFVDDLASRGELVESEAHTMVREILDKRESFLERIRQVPQKTTENASKEDIKDLKKKIAELTAKLDAMEAAKK
ncbi:MAG: phasin family protein [Anaerolineales bacterium]|nr:phasin family protein [Anaerolineales bacterium]